MMRHSAKETRQQKEQGGGGWTNFEKEGNIGGLHKIGG